MRKTGHRLAPEPEAVLTAHAATNTITRLLIGAGLDALAPFGGLQAQPGFVVLDRDRDVSRVLRRLLVGRHRVRRLTQVPAPAGVTPDQEEWADALWAAIGEAARLVSSRAREWRWARGYTAHIGHIRWFARHRITTVLAGFPDQTLLGTDPWTLTNRVLAGDPSATGAHLAAGAGIPDRHPDFAVHRQTLEDLVMVHGYDTAKQVIAEARRRRMAAIRQARRDWSLAEELYGP